MVRLINDNNIKQVCKLVDSILHVQEFFTRIIEVNNPNIKPCIYAMWHGNQFSVYGMQDKSDVNILISNSIDGEIVSYVATRMGFNTVRGSSNKKGAVSSTLTLMNKLKENKCVVVTVDGPNGPLHSVKKGIIKLAKDTGAPIVPVEWFSPQFTFVRFPSWDQMTTPIGPCNIMNLYGNPIYVNSNDDDKLVADKIKLELERLRDIAPEEYNKARAANLWKKH